jgi:2'-5' RNA ligase
MRLFVAIDLPEAIREEVAGLCRGVPGVRWTSPRQLHLTLRFLGELGEKDFARVREALRGVKAPAFSISLKGCGRFPPKGRPRVLWAGVEPEEPLIHLFEGVEEALGGVQIPPEERRFSPHLTLARLRDSPQRPIEEFLQRGESFRTAPFPVSEFVLFSSLLAPSGAIHKKEDIYRLN